MRVWGEEFSCGGDCKIVLEDGEGEGPTGIRDVLDFKRVWLCCEVTGASGKVTE